MKPILISNNYPLSEREFIANRFIIGNGLLGYKATMEEETAENKVTFNALGIYDQYGDKWRESLNIFNPLFLQIFNDAGQLYSFENATHHQLTLHLDKAVLYRHSEFEDLIIKSERFIHTEQKIIASKITIIAKDRVNIRLKSGIEDAVYEINGPHYVTVNTNVVDNVIIRSGSTNENHNVSVALYENIQSSNNQKTYRTSLDSQVLSLEKGEELTLIKIGYVFLNEPLLLPKINKNTYERLKKEHIKLFKLKFNQSVPVLTSEDKEVQSLTNYALYHLLILENKHNFGSIPARGVSGQVYKGAIFWDTEIFMLPFYLLTNPKFAKNLIIYRLNTLNGARHKAKEFGYLGAFYAWESQEDGKERCSLYNVSDPVTNRPIRTYFADKQIHISADVLYGMNLYLEYTGDYSIFELGAMEVFIDIYRFYKSRSQILKGQYHFLDVVGPDEYHERIDDNAFTNYHIKYTISKMLFLIKEKKELLDKLMKTVSLFEIEKFIENIYLPQPNKAGIIEQFSGYFKLEDINPLQLKKRIVHERAYLGGAEGIATPTRVIKQADVVTLLALYKDHFSADIIRKNYDFYEPYTEHGSSLSHTMYGLVAAYLSEGEVALNHFKHSAGIDLSTTQKLYAGGIFIGGTHPASVGGAFLILMYGFLGLKLQNKTLIFNPCIPQVIKKVMVQYHYMGMKKTEEIINV